MKNGLLVASALFSFTAFASEPCPEAQSLKVAMKYGSVTKNRLVKGSMKYVVAGWNTSTLERGVIRTYKLKIMEQILESADFVVIDSNCVPVPGLGGGGGLTPVAE